MLCPRYHPFCPDLVGAAYVGYTLATRYPHAPLTVGTSGHAYSPDVLDPMVSFRVAARE
ncbi:MAG: hypothetical protein V3U26_07630 [Dehalococcoidia bacterium]